MTDAPEANHPIRVVCRRTGLKPDLLRAWERRYGAINPGRSETRRRLYSDADIERIQLLRRAIEGGRSIGQIASLSDEEIEALIEADRPDPSTGMDPASESTPEAAQLLDAAYRAVRLMDSKRLAFELVRAQERLSRRAVLEGVIVPLLRRIGRAWESGELQPSQEHLASAVIRTNVGSLLTTYQPPLGAPRIVVTTMSGQRHELGALLCAATAAGSGWDVTFLGAELPTEDIATAVRETASHALALSFTMELSDTVDQLKELVGFLRNDVAVIVGGRGRPQPTTLNGLAGRVTVADEPAELRRWLSRAAARLGAG